MADPTIRPANVAVLVKLETVEGVENAPDPSVDAIPIEADSITYNSPWTNEASNEATGSLVSGAPLIIGQAATLSFRSRIKGAGPGVTYSATVKPPLHQALQCCGWVGGWGIGVAPALATAGSATTITLPAAFSGSARIYVGFPLVFTAGKGSGATPMIIDYQTGRVATLGSTFSPPLDATTSVSIPTNYTYAQSSPSTLARRTSDQPSATIYIYEDGTLLKFIGCRGTLTADGQNARPGYATFNMTGIYAGKSDAAIPNTLAVASHSAPVLAQGSAVSQAVIVNRKPLAISTWSLDPGSQIENVDDPNTTYGFGPGVIVDRTPQLKLDPLATLVANRDTISDIGNGTTMPAVLRFGSQPGNRWALTAPLAQPVAADPGTRGKLRSEQMTLQLRSSGQDWYYRDADRYLTFY